MKEAICDNKKTNANDLDKEDKNKYYCCPICGEKVRLNCCSHKSNYFSHEKGSLCYDFVSNMSEWHKSLQEYFDEHHREIYFKFDFDSVNRADVCLYDYRVIEFQYSNIKAEKFNKRNQNYSKCGSLFWLFNEIKRYRNSICHIEYTNYYWKNAKDYILDFDFKRYNRVRIFLQINDHKTNEKCIIEIKEIIKRTKNDIVFVASKQMSISEFIYIAKNEDIPLCLKISNGELKDKIHQFEDKGEYFYYKCPKINASVKCESCDSCDYHTYSNSYAHCFYRYKDVKSYDDLNLISKNNNEQYKTIPFVRKWDRTISQLYKDNKIHLKDLSNEFESRNNNIVYLFKVRNILTNKIYLVAPNCKNSGLHKKWEGYEFSNRRELVKIPDSGNRVWRFEGYAVRRKKL